jgi:hypothetical protein
MPELTPIVWGALLAAALVVGLLLPFLVKEIRDGKREFGPLRRMTGRGVRLGPTTPTGAGDHNPGRVGDPAPGEPSGQPDPYGPRAQRGAPPIRS